MIELSGFKKLGERIKEIEKTVGYISYPCDCATEMGKFAQEQFQLDLRAIRQDIDNAHGDFYFIWNSYKDRLPPMMINHLEAGMKILADLISVMQPAIEHKGEGSE